MTDDELMDEYIESVHGIEVSDDIADDEEDPDE